MELLLRPVEAGDQALLLQLYADTRREELARTGWDEARCEAFVRMQHEAQRVHYDGRWPDAEHSVIEARTAQTRHAVGRLWLALESDQLLVLDIAVLSDWRGQGIGSLCLRSVQQRARLLDRPLNVSVELGNPARRLYQRLGFFAEGAPEGLHQRMSWRGQTHTPTEICNEQA